MQSSFEVKTGSKGDTTLLFFDPSKLSSEELSLVYKAFGQLAMQKKAFTTVKSDFTDSLSQIIKQKLNPINNDVTEYLKEVILNSNNLSDSSVVNRGESVNIPRLPVNTFSTKTSYFTQYFDIYNNKSYLSLTKALASYAPSNITNPIDFDQAGLFAYKLNSQDLNVFKTILSDSVFNEITGRGMALLNQLNFTRVNYLTEKEDVETIKNGIVEGDSTVLKMLKGIDKSKFGTYYVFDNFNGACTHGRKVLDVIYLRFAQCGLDTTGIKIIPVSINYFGNEEKSIRIIEDFYGINSFNGKDLGLDYAIGQNIVSTLKKIKIKKGDGKDDYIPEILLNALFSYYYKRKPDIISSSFWTTTFEGKIMPIVVKTNTNLITASLNEDGKKIEDFGDIPLKAEKRTIAVEPLYSFYNSPASTGSIIVGNRMQKGIFKGMYSNFGNGITTLGQGVGWGSDNTKCIKPEELGTSYATPDVATSLFIAKAYWASKNYKCDAAESKFRMLMATDIDSSFVGRFASGGTINMRKLLQTNNGYVELTSGEVIGADFGSLSSIDFNNTSRRPFQRDQYDSIEKTPLPGICGLAFVSDRFFAFFEDTLTWRPININLLNLHFTVGDEVIHINNKDQFTSRFKQISIIKKP